MLRLTPIQIAFLAANGGVGLLVGTTAVHSSAFAGLGIPTFLWLVAGLFALEMLTRLAMKAHPAAIVSMPLRVAGFVLSFLGCYAVLGTVPVT